VRMVRRSRGGGSGRDLGGHVVVVCVERELGPRYL
jgi:hypothetical protein